MARALSVPKVTWLQHTCGVWHLQPESDNRWAREKATAEKGKWVLCGFSRAEQAEDQGMTGQCNSRTCNSRTWSRSLEVGSQGLRYPCWLPGSCFPPSAKGRFPWGHEGSEWTQGKCFFSWPKTSRPGG